MTDFISSEDWLRLQKPSIKNPKKQRPPGRKRINFKKTERYGRKFDSELEADTFEFLKALEAAGEINEIEQQVMAYLTDAEIGWRIDYRVRDLKLGERVWVEAKGVWKPEQVLKKKLWAAGYGPGRLRVFGRSTKRDDRSGGFRIKLLEPEIVPRPLRQSFLLPGTGAVCHNCHGG